GSLKPTCYIQRKLPTCSAFDAVQAVQCRQNNPITAGIRRFKLLLPGEWQILALIRASSRTLDLEANFGARRVRHAVPLDRHYVAAVNTGVVDCKAPDCRRYHFEAKSSCKITAEAIEATVIGYGAQRFAPSPQGASRLIDSVAETCLNVLHG